MATTFELIASATVGSGGQADIDFNTIPSTFTDLCLKLSLRDSSSVSDGDNFLININGVTTNQSQRALLGLGSGTPSSYNDTRLYAKGATTSAMTSSTFGNVEIYLPNYAGSANKSMSIDSVTENNATASAASLVAGLWSSSSAINRITLIPNIGSFVQYSTAYLYGVKNA